MRDDQMNSIPEATPSYRMSTDEYTIVSDKQDFTNLHAFHRLVFIDLLSHDKDVVTVALKEIQELCEPQCQDMMLNRHLLYMVGAHALLLLVMKKWCFCSVVTTIGFRVLHYGSTKKEFAIATVNIGLLQTILMGMKSFPHHRLLQQAGCGVLYTMATVSTNLAHTIFTESEGLQLIVQALRTFPADTYLQRCACDALSAFSRRKELRITFRDSNLANVLVESILLDCRNELNARELDENPMKFHFLPK
jgi:hypothetical protein